jgi:hypothetical protein
MIPFHRLLISTAIAFCAGFAAWAGFSYWQSRGAVAFALALTFLVFAVGLSYYLRHLNRFLGR